MTQKHRYFASDLSIRDTCTRTHGNKREYEKSEETSCFYRRYSEENININNCGKEYFIMSVCICININL